MATKDLHNKPFDQGTVAKLEIFEDYAEAWIPTFVMSGVPRIAIFDFFAGPGHDVNGIPGSAFRILTKIKGHIVNIRERKVKVEFFLNEYKKGKFLLLENACQEFLKLNPDVAASIEIHYFQEDFETLFPKLVNQIGDIPSLVYFDQNGIKALSPRYFQQLESKSQTDFLYFVSSSYFLRFGESEEFKSHLNIDLSEAKKDPYRFIHRRIIEELRKSLPSASRLKLFPYSIKKGSNIYGLIFGASHPAAVEKFLRIVWKKNDLNGEANFDIDDDYSKAQPDLWGQKKLTKLERFKQTVRKQVLSGELKNNRDALSFAYSEGHLGSHVDVVLRSMKANGEISYDGLSPLVTYKNVYKLKKLINYTLKRYESD